VLVSVRPSRRPLCGLLKMRSFLNAIKKAYLMLRSARRAGLEARGLAMQLRYPMDVGAEGVSK